MTAILLPWLKFAVCVALIGLAGPALTRNGDITGLSRSLIGLVLLATATSLPARICGAARAQKVFLTAQSLTKGEESAAGYMDRPPRQTGWPGCSGPIR